MNPLSISVSPETVALLTFFCIGFVKLVDELFSKDWQGAAKVIGSTIVGALVALAVPHLSVIEGAALGLSASGVITGFSMIGKSSSVLNISPLNVSTSSNPAASPLRVATDPGESIIS